MIVASVRLKEPENQFKFIDEGPINVWLLANVGVHAKFKDLEMRIDLGMLNIIFERLSTILLVSRMLYHLR